MTTSYTVPDDPKMLRETLCVAQAAVARTTSAADRQREHIDRIGRLINECDLHRPLGPNGKHGDRHTPTCGCDDVRPAAGVQAPLSRAAATGALAYTHAMTEPTIGHVWQHVAFNILAAALPVEDVARVINEALMGYAPGTTEGVENGAWNARDDEIDTHQIAARIRASILGGAW